MTLRSRYICLAAGGSAALLLAAFAFQHLGGLAPCKLCIWQRYPHGVAIGAGALALFIPGALIPVLGALSTFATAVLGGYHTGVERGWWEGPATCSAQGVEGISAQDLMEQILAAPLVRCDEVAWSMFGLSMASWNMLAALVLTVFWVQAARHF